MLESSTYMEYVMKHQNSKSETFLSTISVITDKTLSLNGLDVCTKDVCLVVYTDNGDLVQLIEEPSFAEVYDVSSSESVMSLKNGKVQDSRISDLEQKLAVAENRCSVLRRKVSYMRMLYTSSVQPDTPSEEDDKNVTKLLNRGVDVQLNEKKFLVAQESENMKTNHIGSPRHQNDRKFHKSGPDNHNIDPPANMAAKSNLLIVDPKETVELMVNKMVESVNTNVLQSTFYEPPKRKPKKEILLPKRYVRSHKRPEINWKTDRPSSKRRTSSEKSLLANTKTLPPIRKPVFHKPPLPKRRPEKVASRETKMPSVGSRPSQKSRRSSSSNMTFLLPTLSYRMKCVPPGCRYARSQQIPFVLGKSTNKSHNIGTKVQETMSLLKAHKGILPSSQQTNRDDQNKTGRGQRPTSITAPGRPHNSMTVGPSNGYKNDQLRTVLMNLHDEFSKMTDKCEELKSSLDENPDPNMAQMARNLEEQLDAKEIEINAFIDLYKQVSQLKSVSGAAVHGTTSEPTSSSQMARLLRRIDNFQNELKNSAY